MIISLIPPEEVGRVWEDAAVFIDAAWDRAPGHYRSIDILDRIIQGVEQLWGIFDEELHLITAFTTRIDNYPLSKRLVISCLGGEKVSEWYEEMFEILKRFAKDQGCSYIEMNGRRGWEFYANKTRWKEVYSTFQFKVEED